MWIAHQKAFIISKLVLHPETFTASAGPAQAALSWSEVEDAVYEIQYKLTTATDWTDVMGTISGLSHVVTGLNNNVEYQFRVRAVIDGVNSKWTDPVTATPNDPTAVPGVPSGLGETAGIRQIEFYWEAAAGAESYELRHREGSSGTWTNVTGIAGLSHTITGLSPNTEYQWQVRARNTNGPSAYAPPAPRAVTTLQPERFFVADTGANIQTLAVGAGTQVTASQYEDGIQWRLIPNLQIDSALLAIAGPLYLNQFIIGRFVASSRQTNKNALVFALTGNSDGTSDGMDSQDMTEAWEQSGRAVRIVAGSFDYTFVGPNNSASNPADTTEVYGWGPPGAVSHITLINEYNALPQTDRDATTLTLNDGGSVSASRIYKSEDAGSSWDSGTMVPAMPQGFSVDAMGLWTLLGRDNKIYQKGEEDWGEGANGPSGVTGLVGIDTDDDGNLFVVSNSTDRFYQRTGITWNTGIPLPSWMTDPQGISWDGGNVYVLDAGTGKYGTYADGSWDNGIDLPAAATDPTGISVRDGIVRVSDAATDKVYKRESGAWDSGIDLAGGSSTGFAISGTSLT